MNLAIALTLGAAAGAALGWLGWRRPGALLAIALASFALGPQWILAGYLPRSLLALALPAQKVLLLAAVVANVARYGRRRDIVPTGRCWRSSCSRRRACCWPTPSRG